MYTYIAIQMSKVESLTQILQFQVFEFFPRIDQPDNSSAEQFRLQSHVLQIPLESATHCGMFQMLKTSEISFRLIEISDGQGDMLWNIPDSHHISHQYIPTFYGMPSELGKQSEPLQSLILVSLNSFEDIEY